MDARANLVRDPLNFYKSVHPDKIIREASKSSTSMFVHFTTEFWMRKDFFQMVNQFYQESLADGLFEKLDPES